MAGWLRGVVSEVPSGDTVIITAGAKPGAIPASKRLTLASLIAPKLVSAMAGQPWVPPQARCSGRGPIDQHAL